MLFIVMEWIDGEPLSVLQKAARNSGGIVIVWFAPSACRKPHAIQ